MRIDIRDAEAHFSRLLSMAREGQEIIITDDGRPVARLVPMRGGKVRRRPGNAKESSAIAGDFATLLPENVLPEFES